MGGEGGGGYRCSGLIGRASFNKVVFNWAMKGFNSELGASGAAGGAGSTGVAANAIGGGPRREDGH